MVGREGGDACITEFIAMTCGTSLDLLESETQRILDERL